MNDEKTARAATRKYRARGAGSDGTIDRTATDWYKDAVVYQLHVKAFMDANNDGMGDFRGLMERLDYVESLGVNVIWLLPFYPSPLRDDGYDIADYRSINPSYGDMRDFRGFIAEAHRRGIRVITELVINHTSDQHPWFQRARRAKPGSAARDYYVWSDTDEAYQGTRIIFLDTEKSNWTWDPEAHAFFWHRFYSHQPDLNFDNPRVMEEVTKLLHYWLEMGVDGLRLDAIPYLIEREGTNNENLPETHDVLKKIRAEVDARYQDRMLLAEANQWPEDTRPYFGDGDECHMAFHFPLMPRMYMALAQEDRHPVTDIIRQTPEIPEQCQWAIFLRNHDELTLEMVTAEERDYLWRTYASDSRARINLGIRRRLAPLLDHDRRKIELMNALLLSMPGTPVLYYGDELGMGDNYYLGDRDGVRTPMQWSADRNGGFSRANPQQLYLPPIQDPIYGFQAVNVEAQQGDPSSLLNWMRRMIGVRKQHKAFGRGELSFLYPANRKVLAYIRRHEDERILCVANLSRQAQAVELDLAEFRHAVPVEMTGGSAFPPVGDLPYMLTLPGYGFYWFLLADEADAPSWHAAAPDPLPEFVTVTATGGRIERAIEGRERQNLTSYAVPEFTQRQRWFAGKATRITKVDIRSQGSLPGEQNLLTIVRISTADGGEDDYFLPLSVMWGEDNLRFGAPKLSYTLAKARYGPNLGALIDAVNDERFLHDLLGAMQKGATLDGTDGRIVFHRTAETAALEFDHEIRSVGVEQSNASFIVGDTALLKVYRRLRPGAQPEIEVARFLTEKAGFANTPPYLGHAEFVDESGTPMAFSALFGFVRNQGDAWGVVVDALDRDLDPYLVHASEGLPGEATPDPDAFSHRLSIGDLLGRRTAEMHAAFATPTDDEAFRAEPVEAADIADWTADVLAEAEKAFARVGEIRSNLPDGVREGAAELLDQRQAILDSISAYRDITPEGVKTRIHGDYHLGQVLVAQDDVYIIDFEGEPQRSLEERRMKSSPLRDVAGMLRSFDYAAWTGIERVRSRLGELDPEVAERAIRWRDEVQRDFMAAYEVGADPAGAERRRKMLELFLLQKAFYEVNYEAANRPAWLPIPLKGVLDLVFPKKDIS